MKTSLFSDRRLPVVLEPADEDLDVAAWMPRNRDSIATMLARHGGILFRNCRVTNVSEFQKFIDTMSDRLIEYSYRSTPRTQINGNIYTSTEYPPDQTIPMHNEMSYSTNWPMKIWFCCIKAADRGGETSICDSRRVFEKIDPAIRRVFTQKGVMYLRNYHEEIGLPWQTVFNTNDRTVAELFCRDNGIDFEWVAGKRLRTRQVCQAVARHPQTGEPVWFNQAHLFHVSSLDPQVTASLLALYGDQDLPRTALYGDGSPIEESVLQEIRGVYDEETIVFPWTEGDVLMLDNMLAAHGRMPFSGERKVVVGMAEAVSHVA
jgi:alpha-ketoglutarate-dependent taurine dioxygenase